MEYYTSIKRNKVLINSTTWMNLENISLNERSQTQYHTVYDSIYRKGSEYAESKLVITKGWGGEEMGRWRVTANSFRVSV